MNTPEYPKGIVNKNNTKKNKIKYFFQYTIQCILYIYNNVDKQSYPTKSNTDWCQAKNKKKLKRKKKPKPSINS